MSNIEQDSAFNGGEVILIGSDEHGERVTIEDPVDWAGTIPYEILTNINTRVPCAFIES
jgi:alanine racemase